MSKLFTIILTVLLSLPVCVWAVDETVEPAEQEPVPVVNTLDDEIEPIQEEESQFKQPISKPKIAKKFLAAMGGVAASSLTIFFLLSVYNRVRERYICQIKTPSGETSLETPDDLNAAVRTFLDKTDWN